METALPLGPLPVAFTVDLSELPSGESVYYSYTAQPDDVVLGAWFGSVDRPWMSIWSWDFNDWFGESEAGQPIVLGVTPGLTYYFEVGGFPTPPTAALEVSLLQSPAFATPPGAIFINDDKEGRPLAVLSATTGEVLQFRHPFPAGEHGAVLPDGTMLIDVDGDSGHVHLYDPTLTLRAAPVWSNVVGAPITSNGVDRFYLGQQSSWSGDTAPHPVTTIDPTGAFGPTTWMIPGLFQAIGVARDETVLYYVADKYTTDGAVRAWDLVGNVSLGILIPPLAGHAVLGRYSGEVIVLSDETILIPYYSIGTSPTTSLVRRFSRTGTLLQEYPLGEVTVNRVTHALDDLSFWAWSFPAHDQSFPDEGYSEFRRIRLSDGVTLAQFEAPQFNNGQYAATDYTTPLGAPTARFGHSFSCIWFILPQALAGVTPPEPPGANTCPVEFPIDTAPAGGSCSPPFFDPDLDEEWP